MNANSLNRLIARAVPALSLTAAVVLIAIPARLAIAQDAPNPATSAISGSSQAFDEDNTRFLVDFPGGSIPEYLAAVEKAASAVGHDGPLNVVVTNSADDVRLPAIQIKTTLYGAISSLTAGIAGESQEIYIDSNDTDDVMLIRVHDENRAQVEVMSVKAILARGVDEQDLVSAVGIGLEMSGRPDAVDMKLHQETGLLFVRGPREQLQIIRQIVGEMSPPGDQ